MNARLDPEASVYVSVSRAEAGLEARDPGRGDAVRSLVHGIVRLARRRPPGAGTSQDAPRDGAVPEQPAAAVRALRDEAVAVKALLEAVAYADAPIPSAHLQSATGRIGVLREQIASWTGTISLSDLDEDLEEARTAIEQSLLLAWRIADRLDPPG